MQKWNVNNMQNIHRASCVMKIAPPVIIQMDCLVINAKKMDGFQKMEHATQSVHREKLIFMACALLILM